MSIIDKIKSIIHRKNIQKIDIKVIQQKVLEDNKMERKQMRLREKKRKTTHPVEVSEELKKFLNIHLLYQQSVTETIREADIEEILDNIKNKNEIRTNEIEIPSNIVYEFMNIIKNGLKERNLELGILKIDISNRDFSIRNFVETYEDIAYTLKLKIASIKDIKSEEIGFLDSKYGIIYEFAEEEYHIDELFDIIKKLKSFIPFEENENKHDLQRARVIANKIFEQIELYVPMEYVIESQTVTLKNGEKIVTPKFRFLENTKQYASLKNIIINKKADYIGMKTFCRECLRIDGFHMIEHIISFREDNLSTEFVIDDIKYAITVKKDGIDFVKKNNCPPKT